MTTSTRDPGKLRSDTKLILQTRQAQRLVQGRKADNGRPPIHGLTRFGAHMSQIYHCARLDDPYADWAMIRVEEALEQTRRELTQLLAKVESRLDSVEGLQIGIAEAESPAAIDLSFANPYAYLAALEIVRFDRLVRMALTARHVGLMTRDESARLIHEGGRPIRRLLASPMWYQYLGITRKDLELMTALGRKAVERFGEIPPEILSGERRPAYAPERAPVPGGGSEPGADLDLDEDGEELGQVEGDTGRAPAAAGIYAPDARGAR